MILQGQEGEEIKKENFHAESAKREGESSLIYKPDLMKKQSVK